MFIKRFVQSAAPTGQLDQMQTELNADFPMTDADVNDLFATLREKLSAVYEGEVRALATLQKAI